MNNKPFRVGCMGAGQIFNEAHLPAYISLESVELAAVYDPDQRRANSTREHYLPYLRKAVDLWRKFMSSCARHLKS
jgi:predicted dehydrogenase